MPHEKDEFGFPVDPELRRLENQRGILVAMWGGAFGDDERQARIVQEYHSTVQQLFDRGWDDHLDIESELPYALMPPEYNKRHPRVRWK